MTSQSEATPIVPTDWTEPERWVWSQITAGKSADLKELFPDSITLDPFSETEWSEDRLLSSEFLHFILTEHDFVRATPNAGVRIVGAMIRGAVLDIENAVLLNPLWIEHSKILCRIEGRFLRAASSLSFENSLVAEHVNLNGAEIRGPLSLACGRFQNGFSLMGCRVDRNVEMDGSEIAGVVNLNRTVVGGTVHMRNQATFKGYVDLGGVKIGANLEMDGGVFEDTVNINRATIAGSAYLRGNATFKGDVDLMSSRVGSNLEMGDSHFDGHVDLTGCVVAESLLLVRDSAARWGNESSLTLRNARADALQDWWQDSCRNAWPPTYCLEGFTYQRLGAINTTNDADMPARSTRVFIDWLQRDSSSSSQPYEHLASRFQSIGDASKANDIRYASREWQRGSAWSKGDRLRAFGLWLLSITIGYGLGSRYFRAVWWVIGFSVMGAAVLVAFGTFELADWPRAFFASLDQLLPIVTLNADHDAIIFGGSTMDAPQPYGVIVYFYFQQIVGFVLGSFLVAGISGLTQHN